MVEFFDPISNANISYHVDKRMIKYLTKVRDYITKKDKDFVLIIDGYEGSGKSTAAQQWGKFVDPSLNLSRICMTADEFKQAIIDAKPKQCVIYDEAVTGMSSGDSISRIGKLLKSMMMQMRQKNLFVIVIIPSIFELNKYTVLSRARSFFHIYESKGVMGYFVGYNKKDTKNLYIKGKKTYSYKVRSRFIGRFYGKYVVDEQEYRKKKELALFKLDDEDKTNKKVIPEDTKQKLLLVKILKDKGMSEREIAKQLTKEGLPISHVAINKMMKKLAVNRDLLTVNSAII